MKRTLLLIAALLVAITLVGSLGCTYKPATEATVNERVLEIYVRDLASGKCIQIEGVGRINELRVAPEFKCQRDR